jgi:hypothetical protein
MDQAPQTAHRYVEEANEQDLPRLIRDSLDELKAVTAGK